MSTSLNLGVSPARTTLSLCAEGVDDIDVAVGRCGRNERLRADPEEDAKAPFWVCAVYGTKKNELEATWCVHYPMESHNTDRVPQIDKDPAAELQEPHSFLLTVD